MKIEGDEVGGNVKELIVPKLEAFEATKLTCPITIRAMTGTLMDQIRWRLRTLTSPDAPEGQE